MLSMTKVRADFDKINLANASKLGALLLDERVAKGEKLSDISRELTLSEGQIFGLENAHFSAFHSSTYYLISAKKYANYLKIDFDFDSLINPELQTMMDLEYNQILNSIKIINSIKRWLC